MNRKTPALRRDLDLLLGATQKPRATQHEQTETESAAIVQELAIEHLQTGQYQPRQHMEPEALQELADSISQQGIIQPIIVRAISNERYEIIAGERRWRAAQLAGLSKVPVIIKKISDNAAIAMALIENIQREDLNPLEEATALQRLIDEFNLSHQQAAQAVGKSRSMVSNLLRLLQLTTAVKNLLMHQDLEMGHARALLSLPEDLQLSTARYIIDNNLSVRETEKWVQHLLKPPVIKKTSSFEPEINRYTTDLTRYLATAVKIEAGKHQQGKMVIHYQSAADLERLVRAITQAKN